MPAPHEVVRGGSRINVGYEPRSSPAAAEPLGTTNMGYTGRILVARSPRPLSELAAVEADAVLHETTARGDWRSARLDGDLSEAAETLVAETGAPALTAFILDSDIADVEALTPAGVAWHVYLHEATARGYGAPELPHTVDEVTGLALAWSAEAGLTADPAAVRTALGAKNVFAEETFDELLVALGVSDSPAE